MSQQEFAPQSQDQQPERDDNTYQAHPYYWSTQPKTGPVPKSDPPSSYEEHIPPYSYRAQDTQDTREHATTHRQEQAETSARYAHRGNFSPDGDAFEQGYRPYASMSSQWQAPWLRPRRRNRGIARWIILVALGVLLIKPILIVAGIFLAIIGVVAFAILLPIIIIMGIVLAFVVVAAILSLFMGLPLGLGWWRWRSRGWRGYRGYGGYRPRWRGGPGPWAW